MKDKKYISTILTVLLETFINPISELPLSISTSIQAKEMIVHDLLKASEIVKDQMKKFVGKHIGTNFTMLFFAPAKILNTFKNMSKVITCNHYAHSYIWFIFKNPYYFAEMFNRSEISFQYPLAQLSVFLADADGTLKKTRQSQFFYIN